jgi:hypothetical protein
MRPLSIEIIVDMMALKPSDVWLAFQAGHNKMLSGEEICELDGKKCRLSDVAGRMKRLKNPFFAIVFNGMELYYSCLKNSNFSLVWLKNAAENIDDAWDWVRPFISMSSFRNAWVYDAEYHYWQNAKDPRLFSSVGRSYAGLPMKSNGLPPPLERMIIDTTHNPGRRIIRQGYVEAVGAVMWLGNGFWSLTGARKEDVLAANWIKNIILAEGVVRIQTADTPFITAEGLSGKLQEKLRALLFPKSGTLEP